MKHGLLVAALSLASLSAQAADYFVVVPVKGKTALTPTPAPPPAEPIGVFLQTATLPEGSVGVDYSYDLKQHMLITGDSSLDPTLSSWVANQALPPGLSLSTSGVITGKPTEVNNTGLSFEVAATYKGAEGVQVYTIVVNGVTVNVTQLAMGYSHVCALTDAGGLKCWGGNNRGQLGLGHTVSQLTPVDVPGLTSGVTHVAAGEYGTCAVHNGAAKCWGWNNDGQLGDGTQVDRYAPTQVQGLTSGVLRVAYNRSGYAVMVDGTVRSWGWNQYGQLGDGTLIRRLTPVVVSGLSGASDVAAGFGHACAVASGGVKCWGYNNNGQLGIGNSTDQKLPVATSLSSGVVQLYTSEYNTCARVGGNAYCWGSNANSQLTGSTARSVPTLVQGPWTSAGQSVTSISIAHTHACASITDGRVYCWGGNDYGQVGDNSQAKRLTPVMVRAPATNASFVVVRKEFSCAASASGGVHCWGNNVDGRLGTGSTGGFQPSPVEVAF